MKRKYIYISIAAVIVALIVVFMMFGYKSHNWNISESPSESGDEPYDITLVDELLKRSLSNGYEVREASIARSDNFEEATLDLIANTRIDTSLLVIQQYPWYGQKKELRYIHTDDTYYEVDAAYNITVMKELFDFCRNGGRALYVPTNDLEYMGLTNLFNDLYSTENYSFQGEEFSLGDPLYSKEWLKSRADTLISLMLDGNEIKLSNRYAINYYYFDASILNSNRQPGVVHRIKPIIYDPNSDKVYAFVWYFPNGGRLYVCTLGLHFTNLGVTLDNERFVMEQMMGEIDDRPVLRVAYPKIPYYLLSTEDDHSVSKSESKHFSVINKDPSLRLAWILILVFAGCFIFSGLWRRQPVAKAIDVDDLDRTDFVAVREYQFRKSPLLHFLFQTSWLYNPLTDYRQLFQTNYRRVARYIARMSNINLANASDDEFREVANTLAVTQGRSADEIYKELKWISEWALRVDKITPLQFAKSHQIAENYPL